MSQQAKFETQQSIEPHTSFTVASKENWNGFMKASLAECVRE